MCLRPEGGKQCSLVWEEVNLDIKICCLLVTLNAGLSEKHFTLSPNCYFWMDFFRYKNILAFMLRAITKAGGILLSTMI